MERPATPAEAVELYESARQLSGPYNQGRPLSVKTREPFHLVGNDGVRRLDLHGRILADSLANDTVRKRVEGVLEANGGQEIYSPDETHEELDLAQVRLSKMLDETFGGGPWVVDFLSSGTRANEQGLKYGRAALGGQMRVAVLREGYHGDGFMNALIGHSAWQAQSTMPLGAPVTFLDFVKNENGRNYRPDFERFVDCNLGADGMPYSLGEAGVQGVAGFQNIDPVGARQIAIITHDKNGVVHHDIVQVALDRTGEGMLEPAEMFDAADDGTRPDIVTGAKGLGVGYPFAFTGVRQELLDRGKGHLGKGYDTYGRNVAGATAFNVLYDLAQDPAFHENIVARGEQLRSGLDDIQKRLSDRVVGKTGKGLMSGLELDTNARVLKFREIGLTKTGIICCVGGVRGNILRLGFKLDSSPAIIEEGLNKIEDTLKEAA